MSKNVLITGGSGTVGKALSQMLLSKGYTVSWLGRGGKSSLPGVKTYRWNIAESYIDPEALQNADAIVHLAGSNVAEGQWTEERKKEILESRTLATELLGNKIAEYADKMKTLVCASAIGYYGLAPGKIYEETDGPGNDFLASVCVEWEKKTNAIRGKIPARKSVFRVGIVLSEDAGALEKMSVPVRYFAGAPLGTGKQYMPWIHIQDLCKMLLLAIEDEQIEGVYNAVAPAPVTNAEFTKAIGKVLGKPVFLPNVPAFVIRAVFGEMAEIVLGGANVSSRKIQKMGFLFKYNSLEAALDNLLKK